MDLKKRFFRRPLTTVLWLALVIVMTAFLCIGAGLWYSSANLTAIMDELHSVVAVRLDMGTTYTDTDDGRSWHFEDRSLTQEDLDALESLDSVKAVRFHTLTAGYSPELTSLIGVATGISSSFERYHFCNDSYSRIIVTGTVEKIGSTESFTDPWFALRVDQILLANQDYRLEDMISDDPLTQENEEGLLHVRLYGTSDIMDGFIQEGQRYIFYLNYDPDEACPCGEEIWSLGWAPHATPYYNEATILENGTIYSENNNLSMNPNAPNEVIAAPLSGTVEEFLADPANSDWVEAMELWDTVQHSLPVIGTGNLDTVYTFLTQESTIVDGRAFTQEEYNSGARVCLLNQALAEKNGISVGDTIHLSQFGCAFDKYINISLGHDIDGKQNDPQIGRVTYTPDFLTQDESFTVVGIYRSANEWSDDSFSYTPNTIFIPQAAQPEGAYGGVDTESMSPGGNYGVFLSIELKNGRMEDFLAQVQDTRLAGQFYTIDTGLEKAYQSIEAVADSARQVMTMVAAGWLLLLALYVILYQGSQKTNLGIMRSLGASPKVAGNYLFRSGALVAALGVAVGAVISGVVFNLVQSRILETTLSQVESTAYSTGTGLTAEGLAEMAASSQFSLPMLLALSLAQLVIIAAVLWLQSRILAKRAPRRLMGV